MAAALNRPLLVTAGAEGTALGAAALGLYALGRCGTLLAGVAELAGPGERDLLGLRQLFFLIDGLLDRLIYLSYSLAAILGLIGVKLVLHALHENNVPFINEGQPVPVREIGTGLSLSLIVGVLAVTILASVVSAKGRAHNAVSAARRHATEYLEIEDDPARREEIYARLVGEIDVIKSLPEKHRARIRAEEHLMALLYKARDTHDAAAGDYAAR